MQTDMAAVLRTEALPARRSPSPQRAGRPRRADHPSHQFPHPRPHLLPAAGAQRRVVVGNLPGMPPVDGVVDFVPQTNTPEPEAEPSKLTGFGLTLSDGSFLLVAQDATA